MKDWKTIETQILEFWFGAIDNSTLLSGDNEPFATHMNRWCAKDPAIDDDIRSRFEATYQEVVGSTKSWRSVFDRVKDSPSGSLALTVLLDQMPRNMYRDTARMYSHDALALTLSFRAIEAGHASSLPLPQRMFLYLPLMHAEDLALQRMSEELCEQLNQDSKTVSPHSPRYYEHTLASARRHRSVVERFGRFPHRNAILNRANTAKEQSALDDPDDNISF